MKTRLKVSRVDKLSKGVFDQLDNLNLGRTGIMQYLLYRNRHEDLKPSCKRVFLIMQGKQVLSWAIKEDGCNFYSFYTHKSHRHKGYALRLMKYIKKLNKKKKIHLHLPTGGSIDSIKKWEKLTLQKV